MSIQEQLDAVGRAPLLSASEEIILGGQVQKMMKVINSKAEEDYTPEDRRIIKIGRKARDRMVTANMRLVVSIVKKSRPTITLEMQDLVQEGAIGLTRAAEKFDPERGYKFSTYAYWWIRQSITRAVENQESTIKLPAQVQRLHRLAADATISLSEKLGRNPTINEISEAIKQADPAKTKQILGCYPSIRSLDFCPRSHSDGKDSASLVEMISADDGWIVEEQETASATLDLIYLAVECLEPRERELMCKRYGIGRDEMSARELAEEAGTSPQAIKQRLAKISTKIRLVVSRFL